MIFAVRARSLASGLSLPLILSLTFFVFTRVYSPRFSRSLHIGRPVNTHWNGSGPKPADFADQNFVWNALGELVLNNAFKGFNSCLFAYGQSGSGKSYSMTSNPTDDDGKGIVPRAARKIFERRDANTDPNVQQSIECRCVCVCAECQCEMDACERERNECISTE